MLLGSSLKGIHVKQNVVQIPRSDLSRPNMHAVIIVFMYNLQHR